MIGVPDERMGEVGMAFVVPAPGRDVTPERRRLVSREHGQLQGSATRRGRGRAADANASGKVMKFELREAGRLAAADSE